jgi:predicted GNAT superfamily acetyltransferase
MESSRKTYEFHVAVQSTNYSWNDLDRPSSAWKVTLVDGAGAELSPLRIEAPRLPELYESQFFPNRTEFTRTYVIRFDRADSEGSGFAGTRSRRLILRVASPLARAELIWQAK